MPGKSLVIVESPTKAKTIRQFLPKTFMVEASMGHVRDLPQSAADIPEKLKKVAWAKIGVNVDQDFEPLYVVPKGKSKVITQLKKLLKECDTLYLATDEDREGESISWHLLELLKPKVPVKRMVFHEITKSAIAQALKDCRDVDTQLVASQETRRILDRLFGYTLSPLIWKKIAFGLSAGRVQSAGVRLLVERERERMAFKKAVYWDLKAELSKDSKPFEARLVELSGQRLATGKDFDADTGQLAPSSKLLVLDQARAEALCGELSSAPWTVEDLEEKEFSSKPFPPFITSTLQQEANRKLGMGARQAMRTAQSLYEQGFITYMRTDSPNLSAQALQGARAAIETLYGADYLSPSPRQYTSKSKSAQEAHEAIRPAGDSFAHPKDTGLSGQELALYELIWKRTLASQMAEAKKKSVTAKIRVKDALFSATGTTILFAGYLRAYVEGHDDPDAALEDQETLLPPLRIKDVLTLEDLVADRHETKPPARFTEASLVQRLEKEGIGRPSTYASIIGTIQERDYARKVGNALVPTFTAFAVIQLLEKHFDHLIDYKFTSHMEDVLDEIAEGTRPHLPYLKEFYLSKEGLLTQVEKQENNIDADEAREIRIFQDKDIEVRVGRFGPYLVRKGQDKKKDDDAVRASIPMDVAPGDLSPDMAKDILTTSAKGPQSLGKHPDTGEDIYVLIGRFGPYVQLGELKVGDKTHKPKRASVPKTMDYRNLTLEQAVQLLRVPYEVGIHPELKQPIIVNVGRFGPYINCGTENRSLKKTDDVYAVTFERAMEILSEPKGASRRGSSLIKDLGTLPNSKDKLAVYTGKYGPYLKAGKKNYSLPKDADPNAFTLEQALALIQAAK